MPRSESVGDLISLISPRRLRVGHDPTEMRLRMRETNTTTRHEHDYGDSESVQAPGLRFYVYVASCACGAVQVATVNREIAVIQPGEVNLSAEDE